jgi:hypothetical protein
VLCHLLPPNLVLVDLAACGVKKLGRNAGRATRKRVVVAGIVTVFLELELAIENRTFRQLKIICQQRDNFEERREWSCWCNEYYFQGRYLDKVSEIC